MSEHDTQHCDAIAVCALRFNQIDEKLVQIHEDAQNLAEKVTNGLSNRIILAEGHITILQKESELRHEERMRIERRAVRWETAIISMLVTSIGVGLVLFIKHFVP